jgi:uncharacterized membrane-anchored protein
MSQPGESTIFARILSAWTRGELVTSVVKEASVVAESATTFVAAAAEDVATAAAASPHEDEALVQDADFFYLQHEAVLIALLAAVATSFFIAWRVTGIIGHTLQMVRDTCWFLLRIMCALVIFVFFFNYFAPPNVHAKSRELTLAIVGSMTSNGGAASAAYAAFVRGTQALRVLYNKSSSSSSSSTTPN